MRQRVERLLPRGDTRTSAIRAAENDLVAEVVAIRIEIKTVPIAFGSG
jgi:hypothetical protein